LLTLIYRTFFMRHFLLSVALLFTLNLFTGCSKVDDETLRAAHAAVDNGAVIVDVRTPKEYAEKHVSRALNIPIEEMAKTLGRVPREKVLVVYCASGNRSGHATKLLRQNGWEVFDVATQEEFERELPPKEVKQ